MMRRACCKRSKSTMGQLIRHILIFTAGTLLAMAGVGCTARSKASYHLKHAERFFDSGQYERADIEYENVLRNAPQSARAWARLGEIYFYEGRGPETLPVLLKARELDSANLDVRLKLAAVYLELGQPEQARDEAVFVLSRNPQDDEAPLLLARAAATNELGAVKLRLQTLRQTGNRASLETALGILALRRQDSKAAAAHFKLALALNPEFSEAYAGLGALLFAQKDFKGAGHAFQAAADSAPVWSGNGVRCAQFRILTGDPASAEHLLGNIVARTPFYLPAWMMLARLSASQNNYSNALILVGNVLNRDSCNFDGLLFQGRMELILGRRISALRDYQRMARIYPAAPSVFYALAQAYLANDQTNEADGCLVRALDLKPDFTDAVLLRAETEVVRGNAALAIVTLKPLLRRQPRLVQGWLLLADAFCLEGTPGRAVEIYQDLEKSYPGMPEIPVLLGAQFVRQNQPAAARSQFEKALRLAPNYLPAVEQLVDLDLAGRQYTAALERVQQLVVRDPKRAALQLLLGTTLAATGETNQAESAFSKAIRLQPNTRAAYLLLSQLYVQSGQPRKALRELKLALKMAPDDVAALTLEGIIFTAEADYEDARDAYQKVLAIAPDNGIALNNLACILADHLNQFDAAYPLARRAREVAPSDPSVADTLGWILYRRGEYNPALVLLRESAGKLYPVPEVQFHLGMACYMAGFEADAMAAFTRALQLKADFPEEAECRWRLAVLNVDPNHPGADARATLEKWTANHPGDPVALQKLAVIYQSEGSVTKAIATDETILNGNPNNISALAGLARLYAPSDPKKACSFAKSAYDLAPADRDITSLYGRLAFATGDYQRALTLLQFSSQAEPQNPEVLFDLGKAFYSVGEVPEAESLVQKALQSGTTFTRTDEARRFLAMVTLANRIQDPSAAQVNQVLAAAPDDVPALMVKAAICEKKSDQAMARQIYWRILKIYPDFAPAKRELAILYAENPADDALEYSIALQARQSFPGDPRVAKSLGMMVCRQGDYTRAVGLLQESAHQLTSDPQLLYFLGLAQFRLNNAPASKTNLQRALTLDLSGQEAADAHRMLAKLK